MLEKKDRRALLWSGAALVGAACLGHQAFAGNYVELAPPRPSHMAYFATALTPGQSLLAPGVQVLVDDITYAPNATGGLALGNNVFPAPALWPAYPLGPTPSYEVGGVPVITAGYSIVSFVGGFFPGPGLTPVNYDTESWTSALSAGTDILVKEETLVGPVWTPIDTFDESTTFFHATLLARQTVLDTQVIGTRSVGFGLGISESLATLSESRHYQTPKVIGTGNKVSVVSGLTPGTPIPTNVYIKGRVIIDAADVIDVAHPVVTTP